MTQNEFQDWKTDPRTKEIFKSIESECFQIAETLAKVAGQNPSQDRYDSGVIRGMERILEVEYQEENSEDA